MLMSPLQLVFCKRLIIGKMIMLILMIMTMMVVVMIIMSPNHLACARDSSGVTLFSSQLSQT